MNCNWRVTSGEAVGHSCMGRRVRPTSWCTDMNDGNTQVLAVLVMVPCEMF